MSEAQIVAAADSAPDVATGVLVIGAGAAGLVAAMTAREAGADALVIERDALPSGSTSLSAGLVPAAGTSLQRAAGIEDSAELFARDIMAKNHGLADANIVATVAAESATAIEWLAASHGFPFSVVDDFSYPGHSRRRMHGLPSRSGRELIDRLRSAAERAGVDIITEARAGALRVDGRGDVDGAVIARTGGGTESIAAAATILACNGYGANKALVRAHIRALADALYFGHPGNEGDAVLWGEALGASLADLSGHQGHGSVATPHGILITWAAIMEGGVQVNADGERFHDESRGYSEAAADVLAQPGGVAWTIFDRRIAAICRQFEDFRNAEAQGAIIEAATLDELAIRTRLQPSSLQQTFAQVEAVRERGAPDPFGRDFSRIATLAPPYCAVKATGALFHTQGGLDIDARSRVLRSNGAAFGRLFAAGGAARGVSGPHASGYLSGNGLLTAVALGRIAGREAAKIALAQAEARRETHAQR